MHVCLFDIDGTLISSGGAGKAALEAALTSEFGVQRLIDKLELSGRTDRAIVRDLFRMHAIDETPANWQRLRAGYLRHLPGYLASHNGRILPGIVALLEQLRARGVVLGLLTGNIHDGARIKLGHFDLYHHFALGGFGDEHFERDEVARAALAAVRNHVEGEIALDRIWVIGDTPLDIQCARSIGARVIAVATGWHSLAELQAGNPDLALADLADATPLRALWGSQHGWQFGCLLEVGGTNQAGRRVYLA